MNILITGGSGFLGTHLTELFETSGHSVAWLSQSSKRQKHFIWNISKSEIDVQSIEWADVVIHLAGASVAGKRWSSAYKKEMYDSRVAGTRLLQKAISESKSKPSKLIAASAIGYYGSYVDGEKSFVETDAPGQDYLAILTRDWEKEIFSNSDIIQTSAIRIGIVLAQQGGALDKMKEPTRLGVAAPLGSGNQYMSWIHIEDLKKMFSFLLESDEVGTFNGVAPNPVTNAEMTKSLANAMNRPCFLPNVPNFILKIILGEFASFVVLGTNVSSQKIEDAGFKFQYPHLQKALEYLV